MKSIVSPYQLVENGDMGENFTSEIVDVMLQDNLGLQVDWTNNTAYNVGDLVRDVPTQIVYRCKETHISNVSGTMGLARMNNPALPRHQSIWVRSCIIIAEKILVPGANSANAPAV